MALLREYGGRDRWEETSMQPDLELVHIRKGESFAAWRHG